METLWQGPRRSGSDACMAQRGPTGNRVLPLHPFLGESLPSSRRHELNSLLLGGPGLLQWGYDMCLQNEEEASC